MTNNSNFQQEIKEALKPSLDQEIVKRSQSKIFNRLFMSPNISTQSQTQFNNFSQQFKLLIASGVSLIIILATLISFQLWNNQDKNQSTSISDNDNNSKHILQNGYRLVSNSEYPKIKEKLDLSFKSIYGVTLGQFTSFITPEVYALESQNNMQSSASKFIEIDTKNFNQDQIYDLQSFVNHLKDNPYSYETFSASVNTNQDENGRQFNSAGRYNQDGEKIIRYVSANSYLEQNKTNNETYYKSKNRHVSSIDRYAGDTKYIEILFDGPAVKTDTEQFYFSYDGLNFWYNGLYYILGNNSSFLDYLSVANPSINYQELETMGNHVTKLYTNDPGEYILQIEAKIGSKQSTVTEVYFDSQLRITKIVDSNIDPYISRVDTTEFSNLKIYSPEEFDKEVEKIIDSLNTEPYNLTEAIHFDPKDLPNLPIFENTRLGGKYIKPSLINYQAAELRRFLQNLAPKLNQNLTELGTIENQQTTDPDSQKYILEDQSLEYSFAQFVENKAKELNFVEVYIYNSKFDIYDFLDGFLEDQSTTNFEEGAYIDEGQFHSNTIYPELICDEDNNLENLNLNIKLISMCHKDWKTPRFVYFEHQGYKYLIDLTNYGGYLGGDNSASELLATMQLIDLATTNLELSKEITDLVRLAY